MVIVEGILYFFFRRLMKEEYLEIYMVLFFEGFVRKYYMMLKFGFM